MGGPESQRQELKNPREKKSWVSCRLIFPIPTVALRLELDIIGGSISMLPPQYVGRAGHESADVGAAIIRGCARGTGINLGGRGA
jgi:hypothetical protein